MKTLGYFDNIFSFIQSNTDYVEESKYAWGELGKVCGWIEKAGYFLPSEFTYVLYFLEKKCDYKWNVTDTSDYEFC